MWLAAIGVAWQSAILVGIVNFAFDVAYVYRLLRQAGSDDPILMARGIGAALTPLLLWSQAGAPGLIMTALAVQLTDYRARWLFWSSLGLSLLYLPALPFGPLGAIFLLGTLIAKRGEFFARKGARA